MKISACDPCLVNGKVARSGWYIRYKRGPEKVRIDVCVAHKDEKRTYEQAVEVANNAMLRRA